jgi:peptide chain release factor
MPLKKEKHSDLQDRMKSLGIFEEDLVEKFILGSGRGGQKIHKTSSCVYLKHFPSGIEIKCQLGRSREYNRYHARLLLCERLEKRLAAEKAEQQKLTEKIRRQKRRPTPLQKEKMIAEKKRRAITKSRRSNISNEEP